MFLISKKRNLRSEKAVEVKAFACSLEVDPPGAELRPSIVLHRSPHGAGRRDMHRHRSGRWFLSGRTVRRPPLHGGAAGGPVLPESHTKNRLQDPGRTGAGPASVSISAARTTGRDKGSDLTPLGRRCV